MANSQESAWIKGFRALAQTVKVVGIPVFTAAAGGWLLLSPAPATPTREVLGAVLILAALGTYIWQTVRFTKKVESPPPPIPVELQEQIVWMRAELTQNLSSLRGGADQRQKPVPE